MAQARLMNKQSDYTRLGLKKGQVEMWEDGKRGRSMALGTMTISGATPCSLIS